MKRGKKHSKESTDGRSTKRANDTSSSMEIVWNTCHEPSSGDVRFFSDVPLEKLPPSFHPYMQAMAEPLPDKYVDLSLAPPEWLDMSKIKAGQEFARKYYHGVNYAEMLSLLILFAFPSGLDPLVFTSKSHTPTLAYKRYLSTSARIQSWYETEFWKPGTPGYAHLKAVRALHSGVSRRLNGGEKLTPLSGKTDVMCPARETLKADFAGSCPYAVAYGGKRVFLNQCEMSFTQFGFFGLMLLYHGHFGAADATREQLEGFVHLWRYLGYALGIKDEYNFCTGTLDEVKERSRLFVQHVVKPTMTRVGDDWEHMSRCALMGIRKFTRMYISFDSSYMYLCWLLGLETKETKKKASTMDVAMLNSSKFILAKIHAWPSLASYINNYIRKRVINEYDLNFGKKIAQNKRRIQNV